MPTYTVHIQIDEEYAGDVQKRLLARAARAALRHQSAPSPCELTIALTGDEHLHALNKRFLGVDAPTDVLSFPAEAPPLVSTDHGLRIQSAPYLGDIAVSYPRALAQAQAAGHPVEAELQLLVVHGVLHLLGHDHGKKKEKERMWAAQAEILTDLKCEITAFGL